MQKKRDRSRCELCGRAVVTVTLPNGTSLPVDPDPSPDGSVCVVVDRETGRRDAWHARPDDKAQLYKSHFTTCPQAGLFG